MMQGYDKDAAVEFITRCIRKADHPGAGGGHSRARAADD